MYDDLGEVDVRHAAGAEFVLDGVAVQKGSLQALELVRHERIMNIES